MREVTLLIALRDGELKSTCKIVNANVSDLSQVYAILDIFKEKILAQIKKQSKESMGEVRDE